jgi:thiol-disulfide isomerase/thioredoxin
MKSSGDLLAWVRNPEQQATIRRRKFMVSTSLKRIPISMVCLCALIAVVLLPQQGSAGDQGKFKPFKMKTLDGTRKTLSDYANKATLVSFFYPRCPFCNIALPRIQTLYDTYKDHGLSVVLINVVPEENKLIPKWKEQYNVSLPVLIGASQESLQRDYELETTPTEYLLSEKGEVLFYHSGYKPGDEKTLEARVVEALRAAQ